MPGPVTSEFHGHAPPHLILRPQNRLYASLLKSNQEASVPAEAKETATASVRELIGEHIRLIDFRLPTEQRNRELG